MPATVLISYRLIFKTVDSMLQASTAPFIEQISDSLAFRIVQSHDFSGQRLPAKIRQNKQLFMHATRTANASVLLSLDTCQTPDFKVLTSCHEGSKSMILYFESLLQIYSISTMLHGKR